MPLARDCSITLIVEYLCPRESRVMAFCSTDECAEFMYSVPTFEQIRAYQTVEQNHSECKV